MRATAAEPRVRDGGIGASRLVPFAEGDFLDSARLRDILDALGLDADVRRGTRTTVDHASALLLGALLSGAGDDGGGGGYGVTGDGCHAGRAARGGGGGRGAGDSGR
ncbi:hypothetical protein RHMOL_Rhmol05G0153500 [Rhododendron molle]|uniref:Uncharacterized protein n=1 Tax=Rhododendron molle TaxID=49168 RepID=A0ACC0NQC8_RHOML|nr:hypothetical protein RHMOL_Rhmol05G0153500 [Rhododendron molle]